MIVRQILSIFSQEEEGIEEAYTNTKVIIEQGHLKNDSFQ